MKGKDWDDASGQVEVKWPKDENGKLKPPVYNGTFVRTLAALSGDFQAINPDVPQVTRDEILNRLQAQTEDNTTLKHIDYKYDYFSAPNKDKYGTFKADKDEAVKKIVVSSKNVEKDWNAWLDSMKPKVQKVLDELNAMPQ